MHKKLIRTLICDDHAGFRKTISAFLAEQADMEVVAVCAGGAEAIEKCRELNPAILLLDINMPSPDGFEVTRQLSAAGSAVKIIGISVSNSPEYADRLVELGAKGYLSKTSPPDEFIKAIHTVLLGKIYIAEEIKAITKKKRK
jgi:DNA-binding NarL/FixJ family response regulator